MCIFCDFIRWNIEPLCICGSPEEVWVRELCGTGGQNAQPAALCTSSSFFQPSPLSLFPGLHYSFWHITSARSLVMDCGWSGNTASWIGCCAVYSFFGQQSLPYRQVRFKSGIYCHWWARTQTLLSCQSPLSPYRIPSSIILNYF